MPALGASAPRCSGRGGSPRPPGCSPASLASGSVPVRRPEPSRRARCTCGFPRACGRWPNRPTTATGWGPQGSTRRSPPSSPATSRRTSRRRRPPRAAASPTPCAGGTSPEPAWAPARPPWRPAPARPTSGCHATTGTARTALHRGRAARDPSSDRRASTNPAHPPAHRRRLASRPRTPPARPGSAFGTPSVTRARASAAPHRCAPRARAACAARAGRRSGPPGCVRPPGPSPERPAWRRRCRAPARRCSPRCPGR